MAKQCIGGEVRLPDGSLIPLSPAIRAGSYVFLSGQVPFDDNFRIVGEDIVTQTRQVLERIRGVLEEAGCGLGDVVKTTAWLTRQEDFATFNKVYAEYFPTDPPARSTVRADLMGKGLLVEIEVVAYKPR